MKIGARGGAAHSTRYAGVFSVRFLGSQLLMCIATRKQLTDNSVSTASSSPRDYIWNLWEQKHEKKNSRSKGGAKVNISQITFSFVLTTFVCFIHIL